MTQRLDTVWHSPELTQKFLTGVRGAIPGAALQLDVMARIVATIGGPVRSLLDLGCGGGTLAAALLDLHPSAKAMLVDFSEPMIANAKAALGQNPNCEFAVLDYADPAWVRAVAHAAPFDAIVSGFSIHHQPDDRKRRIYREIFDLLAPGGVFVNIEHVTPSSALGRELFDGHMVDNIATLERAAGQARPHDAIRAEYINRPDMQANILSPIDEQVTWLREIGFADADCYMKIYELAVIAGRKPSAT
jgi:SAM-dependent methyltransferase